MNRQLKWEHDIWIGGSFCRRYSVKCDSMLHFFSVVNNSVDVKTYKYDKTNLHRQLALTGKWRIVNSEDDSSELFIEFTSEFEATTYDRVQSWYQKLFKQEGTVIDTENFTTEDIVVKHWVREGAIVVEELYDNDCTCTEEELTQPSKR